jgi:hypothetical protein
MHRQRSPYSPPGGEARLGVCMVLEHSWPILAEGCAVVYAGPESFAFAWDHSSSSERHSPRWRS